MRGFVFHSLTALSLLAFGAVEASAMNLGGSAGQVRKARASFISERGPVLAPMGHVAFCLKIPTECRKPDGTSGPVDLTADRRAELVAVNEAVNRTIAPRHDRSGPGVIDQWTLAPRAGDCEDYAITKRSRLIERGWPASALRLAIGRTSAGEGHAVLVIRTASGDLVLDNRTDAILPWYATDIRWVSMQSSEDPRFWREI
ncbi:transglutaminase-like cysteine peptidase [Prosthecomicrobium sp. N25]|uniref:transglutaminase-like cysteine peptidase n=1 Tax=Prosthecomicrobium sp. N25 TaxID=3129254 RepID=UPI0030785514